MVYQQPSLVETQWCFLCKSTCRFLMYQQRPHFLAKGNVYFIINSCFRVIGLTSGGNRDAAHLSCKMTITQDYLLWKQQCNIHKIISLSFNVQEVTSGLRGLRNYNIENLCCTFSPVHQSLSTFCMADLNITPVYTVVAITH